MNWRATVFVGKKRFTTKTFKEKKNAFLFLKGWALNIGASKRVMGIITYHHGNRIIYPILNRATKITDGKYM